MKHYISGDLDELLGYRSLSVSTNHPTEGSRPTMMIVNQKRRRKKFFTGYISIMMIILFSYDTNVYAETEEVPQVLVIYSSENGEIDEYQRTLDLLIGHFTTNITFKSSQEVTKADLTGVTHLFYYGQVVEKLPVSFVKLFDDYAGHFIALGYNAEHLGDQFTFVNPLHESVIEQLSFTNSVEKSWEIVPEYIIEIETLENEDILVEGKQQGSPKTYPVVVKKDHNYYLAIDNLNGEKKVIVGEILHEIFQVVHEEVRPAYIRLEDIHPLVNPQKVKEITEILKEKNIPFMMAVIPIYINPNTGQQYHFSDSPKLLKVLKEAQENGGSVVLHGYTHQYRKSETGEGFEFWDVENNTPIYAEANKNFDMRNQDTFSNKAAYESYVKKLTTFETVYTHAKITQGIQELTNYGLYPLAFEAPHYTMSQNGYQIVSEYFSTYVGQIQLSDKDWEIMDTTPYITKPSFLNGLEVLPETMGYVGRDDPQAIEKMMDKAESYDVTNDGVLGAFYHPFLGVEEFMPLIEKMEKRPNIEWINLQERDVWVKAENVEIETKNGEIVTDIKQTKLLLTSIDFSIYHLNRWIVFIFWAMAIVGGIAVIAFIGFTVFLSIRRWKREHSC